jgi:cold shock CspA family protein
MSETVVDKLTGQVKWFNNKTGYGFITALSEGEYKNKDIFVHYSNLMITNSQYKYLVQGEYIEFNAVKPDSGDHEFHAINVSGVLGGNLMCEVRYTMSQERITRTPKGEENPDWQSNTKRRPKRVLSTRN